MQSNTDYINKTAGTARKFREALFGLLLDPAGRRKRVNLWRLGPSDRERFYRYADKVANDWNNRERVLDDFSEDNPEVEDVRMASEVYHQTLISNWNRSEDERRELAAPALALLEEAEATFRARKHELAKRAE
jgi:hypothetical protein